MTAFPIEHGDRIALFSRVKGRYVCADQGGAAGAGAVTCDRGEPKAWETFFIEKWGPSPTRSIKAGDFVALRSINGFYLRPTASARNAIRAEAAFSGLDTLFTIEKLGPAGSNDISAGDRIALAHQHGIHRFYAVAEFGGDGPLNCDRPVARSWETFDIAPMPVLRFDPPAPITVPSQQGPQMIASITLNSSRFPGQPNGTPLLTQPPILRQDSSARIAATAQTLNRFRLGEGVLNCTLPVFIVGPLLASSGALVLTVSPEALLPGGPERMTFPLVPERSPIHKLMLSAPPAPVLSPSLAGLSVSISGGVTSTGSTIPATLAGTVTLLPRMPPGFLELHVSDPTRMTITGIPTGGVTLAAGSPVNFSVAFTSPIAPRSIEAVSARFMSTTGSPAVFWDTMGIIFT